MKKPKYKYLAILSGGNIANAKGDYARHTSMKSCIEWMKGYPHAGKCEVTTLLTGIQINTMFHNIGGQWTEEYL